MNTELDLLTPTDDEILDEIKRLEEDEASANSPRFVTSFAEFMSRTSSDGELIGFHAYRGELVLIQSVTNKGKSTLARNAAIALATGRTFAPLVEAGTPRKVILLNFEGSEQRFRNDLEVMTEINTPDELELLGENLFPTHDPAANDEPLCLSHHMKWLEVEGRRHKTDVIIIDTVSAGFTILNENDNGQVGNTVMKPLSRLARKLNCLVVLIHHIGKAKSEEGQVKEAAHRGRGASTFGDYATSSFNLEAHTGGADCRTLTCGKRKDGGEEYSVTLRLDRITRWFAVTNETPLRKVPTKREIVRAAVTRPMQKSEIMDALKDSGIPDRSIERYLSEDVKDGLLTQPAKGIYAPADRHNAPDGPDALPF